MELLNGPQFFIRSLKKENIQNLVKSVLIANLIGKNCWKCFLVVQVDINGNFFSEDLCRLCAKQHDNVYQIKK